MQGRALTGQSQGDGISQATAGTGDQGGLSFQVKHETSQKKQSAFSGRLNIPLPATWAVFFGKAGR
jgi:hypothetical protein